MNEMKSYKTIWADFRHGQGWMCPYCVEKRSHTLVTHNHAMFRLPLGYNPPWPR